jgi:hypothetical protein
LPDSCVGVLCGKNDIATPLENCAASITSVKIDVPKWEPLYLAVDTMENVKVNFIAVAVSLVHQEVIDDTNPDADSLMAH